MEINIRENRRGNPETMGTQDTGKMQTNHKNTKNLKDEQHKPHQKLGVNPAACKW